MSGRKSVEVEFRIGADGRVTLTVRGRPGPSCLEVAEAFEALGETLDKERTSEFYQEQTPPEVSTRRRS